jgi:tetraacyldisaccharide 4'-kinase
LNQHDFEKLVSGRSSGLYAGILRLFLGAASCFYSAGIYLRNFLYSRGWLKIHRVNAIVFSIGNITVGGTGKTPLVIWLYNFLQQNKIQCAILTRGYKTHTKGRGTRDPRFRGDRLAPAKAGGRETKIDEPAILAEMCPQAKVVINPDRVEGANEAVNKFSAKVLIMDDGFQHRRLARKLDIVTIDATRPFGYGRMLPAGLLREPVASLKRADAVVITRSDQIPEKELAELEGKLLSINNNMVIARAIHSPICAKTIDNKEISIERLKDRKIFAFCGIGNPDAFLNTIKGIGAELAGSKIYDDHYHYADEDIADISREAMDVKADLILTTQKDWTRITGFQPVIPRPGWPWYFAYLAVELKIISGEDRITQLIKDCISGKIVSRASSP